MLKGATKTESVKSVTWWEISLQERKLLEFFRNQLQYGEAHVIVKKGQPVFVKQAIQEIKLD